VPSPPPDVPTDGLTIEIRREHQGTLVVVTGNLDQRGVPLLSAVMEYIGRSEGGGPVAVDLSGVPYADPHGMLPLLRAGVVVLSASPWVRGLLHLLGAPPPRGIPLRAQRPSARHRPTSCPRYP
jgi:hypothetical protein